MKYRIEIKQLVDYPRCRIYRKFVETLITDRNLHNKEGSGLFYYVVLCSYANFRSSYQRIEKTSYVVHAGEWILTLSELTSKFRTKYQYKTIEVLDYLQKQNYINYTVLERGKVIKYQIVNWQKFNTVLDYNAPCQKDSGFFFFPVFAIEELISMKKCSELDIILDLWLNTVYKDDRVQGSDLGPVVYYRNYTGDPFISYTELSERWGISRSTVSRVLSKLARNNYLTIIAGTGKKGSIIYLNNYLSTMFQISDVLIDKEEVAMSLCFNMQIQKKPTDEDLEITEDQISVSENIDSVSKSHVTQMLSKVSKMLYFQGLSCCQCSKSHYKLYDYPNDCKDSSIYMLEIECPDSEIKYCFEIKMSQKEEHSNDEN